MEETKEAKKPKPSLRLIEQPKPSLRLIEQPKPSLRLIEQWERFGVPCRYVRVHQPIPPYEDAEPVSEFRLGVTINSIAKNTKYTVDSITYTEHGVIWRARGELNICGLAQVMYARSCLK